MIEVIDTITGSPCYACGEPIGSGYALTEVRPDDWQVICVKCDLVTEEASGK
jgi:hypothetical protein